MTMDWEESPTPAPSRGPESDAGDSPALLLSHDELRHIFQFVPELDRCAEILCSCSVSLTPCRPRSCAVCTVHATRLPCACLDQCISAGLQLTAQT